MPLDLDEETIMQLLDLALFDGEFDHDIRSIVHFELLASFAVRFVIRLLWSPAPYPQFKLGRYSLKIGNFKEDAYDDVQ